jgi:hypothetical protein
MPDPALDDHMTEPEIRDYAEALILWRSKMIEPWDVLLQTANLTDRKTLDEADTQAVLALVKGAVVTVHFD